MYHFLGPKWETCHDCISVDACAYALLLWKMLPASPYYLNLFVYSVLRGIINPELYYSLCVTIYDVITNNQTLYGNPSQTFLWCSCFKQLRQSFSSCAFLCVPLHFNQEYLTNINRMGCLQSMLFINTVKNPFACVLFFSLLYTWLINYQFPINRLYYLKKFSGHQELVIFCLDLHSPYISPTHVKCYYLVLYL